MSRRSRYRSGKTARPSEVGGRNPGQQADLAPPERPAASRASLPPTLAATASPMDSGVPATRSAPDPVVLPGPNDTVGPRGVAGLQTRTGAQEPDATGEHAADSHTRSDRQRAASGQPGPPAGAGPDGSYAGGSGCTAPQLRRFIKSRSWVPMHELRRRFAINGPEDDVTPVAVNGLTIYLGLPSREGQLLGELLRAGDIGYELSLDPETPVVIGVYPMRPVPRH